MCCEARDNLAGPSVKKVGPSVQILQHAVKGVEAVERRVRCEESSDPGVLPPYKYSRMSPSASSGLHVDVDVDGVQMDGS